MLPFIRASIIAVDWTDRSPPSMAAAPTKIVQISENSERNTKRQNSTSDAESTAVLGLIVLAEDLGAVDASNIRSHDHQRHGESALFRVVAGERHPGDVQGVGEGSEDLRPDHAEVGDVAFAEFGEDAVEDVAQHVHA